MPFKYLPSVGIGLILGLGSCPTFAFNSAWLTAPVAEVRVEGVKNISVETLLKQVYLETLAGKKTTLEKLQHDKELFFLSGYFSAVSITGQPADTGIIITFLLQEHPIVADIQFNGNQAYTDDALRHLMQNTSGKIFNGRWLKQDIDRISAKYQDDGYTLSRIKDAQWDPASRVLTFSIAETIVDDIYLEGLDRTQSHVVRREMKLQPGEVFNSTVLRTDRNRIIRLGYFSSVSAPKLKPGKDSNSIAITLTFHERKINQITFGAEQEEISIGAFANLTLLNFVGTGESLVLKGQIGTEQEYSFRYFNPWLFTTWHTSLAFDRWYEIGPEILTTGSTKSQLSIVRNGWDIIFGFPLTDELLITSLYKNESVAESPAASSTLTPYIIRSILMAVIFDTRNSQSNPTRGLYSKFEVEQGGNLVIINLDGLNFGRYAIQNSIFWPFSDHSTLGLNIAGGIFRPNDANLAVLEAEGFEVGGTNTVRGYSDDSPIQGPRKIVANIEYRQAFNELLQTAVFYDYGLAFAAGAVPWEQFKQGHGVGLRVFTPMGPLRLDFAWGDTTMFFHFGLGQMF